MVRICLLFVSLLAGPLNAETLDAQLARLTASVERFQDISIARAEGWRRVTGHVNLMGEHWARRDNLPDYTRGDAIDFAQPSNLLYAEVDGRMELISAAFVVRIGPGDPHPDGFTGFRDLWHVHNIDEILDSQCSVRPFLARVGRSWVDRNMAPDGLRRLAMVHVWLGPDNPNGLFSNFNPHLPYQRLGLAPASWQGDMDAARGMALAHRDGCRNELDGDLFLADASGSTKRQLKRACRSIARQVRDRLDAPASERDAFAAAAWRTFDALVSKTLTPAEQGRIDALVEGDADLPSMQ
ncbi:MAG: hypothetical protein AAF919_08270 [Pseudomonadota bacterium]